MAHIPVKVLANLFMVQVSVFLRNAGYHPVESLHKVGYMRGCTHGHSCSHWDCCACTASQHQQCACIMQAILQDHLSRQMTLCNDNLDRILHYLHVGLQHRLCAGALLQQPFIAHPEPILGYVLLKPD